MAKPWRRTSSARTPATAGACIMWNDVFQDHALKATWDAGQPIASIVDPTQFKVSGAGPLDTGTIAGNTVEFLYAGNTFGFPWTFGASSALTLVSGDVVCPGQSGVVD